MGNEFARALDAALAEDASAPALWYVGGAQDASQTYARGRVDALARAIGAALRSRGVRAGDYVPVDVLNCPLLACALVAAARGGWALVTLNARLAPAEKRLRLQALSRALGRELPEPLGEDGLMELAVAGAREGAQEPVPAADGSDTAVVMFTSGTTGTPKAVPLTWENLCGSARAANARLGVGASAVWQATLPLCHVGGLQMLVRSVLAGRPLVLYRSFCARRVLADAEAFGTTHISVVNKTLADLLDADDERARAGLARAVPAYRCMLLGGAVPSAPLLARAVRAGAHVCASFGMTETASLVACAEVGEGFDGTLRMLDGYMARACAREVGEGAGELAVAGPGVTAGYLNAPTPRTPDGFLLTGDVAEVGDGTLRVRERVGDMFVSGGENVYPAEVEAALRELPGVRDACVVGVPDETWGRRPVAFVEGEDRPAAPGETALRRGERLRTGLAGRLSRITTPDRVWCVSELPRMGIGKPDRTRMRTLDAARTCARRVEMFLVEQSFVRPVVTPKARLETRRSLLARVTDAAGREGLAEGVAFETPWYLPETLGEDAALLAERLVPAVLGETFLTPGEVWPHFVDACPEVRGLPMAAAALEPAFWDLHAQALGVPLWELLVREAGGQPGECEFRAPAGAAVGICGVEETLARVDELVRAGYGRVKLKVRPGDDVARVAAVRSTWPDLVLTLDANQSYPDGGAKALERLDGLGAAWIEEPLAPHPGLSGRAAREELWGRLERLQGRLHTPVCLDESFHTGDEACLALQTHPGLRCFALKIAKFGGVGPALAFWRDAREVGATTWMAGMFDTSVSKRLHAAFEALPGMDVPGDVCGTGAYFAADVAAPGLAVERGAVRPNAGVPTGLGCRLDEDVLKRTCVRRWSFSA